MINPRKKSLKKLAKPTTFFLMKKEKPIMINLDMLLLKAEEDKGLETLILVALFQIYLRIFSVMIFLDPLAVPEEDRQIEEMI